METVTMAIFLSAVGVGQVAGSLTLARKSNKAYIARNLWIGYVLLGCATAILIAVHGLIAATITALLIGFAVPLCVSGGDTVIQMQAADRWRGRATGIYFTVFLGSEPLGYPVGGFIADHISVPVVLMIAAAACFAAGIWYWHTNPVSTAAAS